VGDGDPARKRHNENLGFVIALAYVPRCRRFSHKSKTVCEVDAAVAKILYKGHTCWVLYRCLQLHIKTNSSTPLPTSAEPRGMP
jgi:hypothetical protein